MDDGDGLQLPADARGRLLGGLAQAIVEKGYGAATIADVVRHARVSKRTFYEHFADKEACYLALYGAVGEHLLGVIEAAIHAPGEPWRARVAAAAHAYLGELAAQPALTRTFSVEIQAAGPRARAARREVVGRFAAQLQALTAEETTLAPLSPELAMALAGGIDELVRAEVEADRAAGLPALSGVVTELILAVVAR
jgi:AcrR family transcriptional regulator